MTARASVPFASLALVLACGDSGGPVPPAADEGTSGVQGSSGSTGSDEPGSSGDAAASTDAAASSDGGNASDSGDPPMAASLQLHLTSHGAAPAPIVPGLAAAVGTPQTASPNSLLPTDCLGSPPTPVGQAEAAQLESLRYYVSSILLCESLETMGTGFSNAQGCLTVYEAPIQDDYPTFLADQARAHPERYVDLLDPASLATLASPVSLGPEHVRAYSYGLVNWYRPVFVRASVDLWAGGGTPTTLFTHDGTLVTDMADPNYLTNEVADLTVGPAEDGVAVLNNGGNWFKFQAPFEITDADVASGAAITLDLVFDPDRIVSGMNCTTRTVPFKDPAGRAIAVPLLELSPVPLRAGQQAYRETYLVHVDDPGLANRFDLRIELYGVDGDPTQTIYGVDLKGLLTADSAGEPMAQKVSFVATAPDGTLELQDYASAPMIRGLSRLAAPGDAGTLVLPCNGSLPALGEQGCVDGEVAASYELIEAGAL